jgi:uncharacterized protein
MISREIENSVQKSAKQFPLVGLIGPRQSGKTTLAKKLFPDYKYISLEDLDSRTFATEDPRGFLSSYPNNAILDEVQRVPELFSYLQSHTDKSGNSGQYILTGSQHFLMMESITQSLAGRIALHKLLPFSLEESTSYLGNVDFHHHLFYGGYPRIFDSNIPPDTFYQNYIQTYIERDVRNIKQITDLSAFQKFVKLCAGRTGQMLNLSSLANDTGITHNTAKSWLSVLEESFIIFLLRPHHKNFNKRLIKSPKLFFIDSGLAAHLLGVEEPDQLISHHLVGNLFENLIQSEYLKYRFNRGLSANGFFWRNKTGYEIDLLIEKAEALAAIEIKSGKTINRDYFKHLRYWQSLTGNSTENLYLIYGGDDLHMRSDAAVYGWKNVIQLFDKIG